MYVVFALFDGGRRYDVYCELLTERVELPRVTIGKRRSTEYVQKPTPTAWRQHVRMAPWNWFNFYDFWLDASPAAKPDDHP